MSEMIQKIIDKEYNHARTQELGSCVDANGCPIPWMTYPAIFYINQLDLSGKDVFEWGAGNSSLFFAQRAKSVTSVESKKEWCERVLREKKDNITVIHAVGDDYHTAIDRDDRKYDVIVIDGELATRLDCAKNALRHLKDDGMIILDNSDWLHKTCEYLRNEDLLQVDMAGFGPINDYTWCTTFYLTRGFDFRSRGGKQPTFVPGGLSCERDQ